MTVPAFAKEAAEKAVSDFREKIAAPSHGHYEMTTAIHPRDLLAAHSPVRVVEEYIIRSVRSLVFDMITKDGAIPGCPQLSLREGEKYSIHEGVLLLQVKSPTVAQDDKALRELTKALGTLIQYFPTEGEPAKEAARTLLQHGHIDELPPHLKGKARPYG